MKTPGHRIKKKEIASHKPPGGPPREERQEQSASHNDISPGIPIQDFRDRGWELSVCVCGGGGGGRGGVEGKKKLI